MTSLAFMLELVPEPVWNTSMGNWSSCSPSAISPAAAMMASAFSAGSLPRSLLTCAQAAFSRPSARIWVRSRPRNEIGKFSTARWVWARHRAFTGTRTSPMVSCSMRYSSPRPWTTSHALIVVADFGYGSGYAADLSPVKSTAEYSLSLESRW